MRRLPRYCIALIGTLVASMIGIGVAYAASNDENSFVSRINSERSTRGLSSLRWNEDLASVARRHARRMADSGNLHHNPNLRNEVEGWEIVGENVGFGPNVDELHRAFMDSASHRANVLDRDYTLLGTGTVWRDGTLWVTEVFMKPQRSSSRSVLSAPRTSSR
ncbi:MAG: CAP domain-containing protein, partial [Actinomycetota bacterium]